MDIAEIEEAVDRIFSKRTQQEEEPTGKKPRKQFSETGEYDFPNSEEDQPIDHKVDQSSKSTESDRICTGRYAEIIDSLVASKKKIM
jgi:hypothetical protein